MLFKKGENSTEQIFVKFPELKLLVTWKIKLADKKFRRFFQKLLLLLLT